MENEEFIGVELDQKHPMGGSGTIKDEKLFPKETEPGFSYFVKREAIECIGYMLNGDNYTPKSGNFAILKGLNRVPEFNEMMVKIICFVKRRGRWKVQLVQNIKLEKKYLGCKAENLQLFIWKPLCKYNGLLLRNTPGIDAKIQIRNNKINAMNYRIAQVETRNIGIYIYKKEMDMIQRFDVSIIKKMNKEIIDYPKVGDQVMIDQSGRFGIVKFYDEDITIKCYDDNGSINVRDLEISDGSNFGWKYRITTVLFGFKVKTWDGWIGKIVYIENAQDITLKLDEWNPNYSGSLQRFRIKLNDIQEVMLQGP